MRTEGILRLLNGESFALHPDDKEILFTSPIWEKLRLEQLRDWPNFNLKGCYEFKAIDPAADEVFLWSPFADCLCSYTEACCEDGTPFPSMEGCISEVFPHLRRVPFERVFESWRQLIQRLSHVQKKGIVLYPPDLMVLMRWEQHHEQELINHVNFYNKEATSLFSAHGWQVFSPDPVPDPELGDWSDYSKESKRQLWRQIEEVLYV